MGERHGSTISVMPRRIAIIDLVGLSPALIGKHTPTIASFAREKGGVRTMRPTLPAVTTSVQASMLTGVGPDRHGIVGNGWMDPASNEVALWKQSDGLVEAERLWDTARRRDSSVTCANICWWYAMHTSCDTVVTPRPIYKADGRKLPDCLTQPADLRDRLTRALGPFPLFRFWGPLADITSTRWIADAAIKVERETNPTITLVYLPHLDYGLQKLGPDHPDIPLHLKELDHEVSRLLEHFISRGVEPILVSEYGIVPVTDAVAPNRVLREAGLLYWREEQGREMVDPGTSGAFAVADHQVAHLRLGREGRARRDEVARLLSDTPGVAQVLEGESRASAGLDHPRAGDLVLVSDRDRWFCHDWWLDDARAPDYQRTVDIHRKPGYDPRELFVDPAIRFPKLAVGSRIIRRKLGFRTLLDVVPTDTSLVGGSHGRIDQGLGWDAVLIADAAANLDDDPDGRVPCTAVRDLALATMFG